MKKSLVVLVVILPMLLIGSSGAITLSGGEANGTQGSTVRLPLTLEEASVVGSLDLTLVYDPDVARAIGVDRGALARNAMLESNTATPGEVRLGIVDSNGIGGSGELVQISFMLIGGADSMTPVVFRQARVHDVGLKELSMHVENGSIRVVEGPPPTRAGSPMAPVAVAGGIAIAMLLIMHRRQGAGPR